MILRGESEVLVAVVSLYFLCCVLHVLDYIIPSSGSTFISCAFAIFRYDTSGFCFL